MPDKLSEVEIDELKAYFADQMRWAELDISIEEIAQENKALVKDIARYDFSSAISLIAGLLTLPDYQSNCLRFEIIAALAVIYCRGRKKVGINDAARWFYLIGKSRCVLGEDPAEDVFVSLVQSHDGDFRVLEGIWEAAGFYTQRILDVIQTMPDKGQFLQIKKSVRALLVVSDLVCEKAGLRRYQLGSEERHSNLSTQKIPSCETLKSRVTIRFSELEQHGIRVDDLRPFMLLEENRATLLSQQVGLSYLDRCPLMSLKSGHIIIGLPTSLSVAVRNYVIENIIAGGFVDAFNTMLATSYSTLFSETPLLGGRTRAPVLWRKVGEHRIASFYTKIDHGYFIHFQLILPSVRTHQDGGFKEPYREDALLTEVLHASIYNMPAHFQAEDDFKGGLIVLIGCGWGKGYATRIDEPDFPGWRFVAFSAADLVRLSWLKDMSPGYFWRIQDGLEAIEMAGVHIANPNGILNLIGWVQSNDGHFVPHAQLPRELISPEHPLMLQLPSNLLRQVRADCDLGYDRHCASDNTGASHDIQHESPNSFFSAPGEKKVYASMDEVKRGRLTSVYEGNDLFWLSIVTPNITDKEIEFRLWEMAGVWLSRIGNALEKEVAAASRRLKVYVVFYDANPPERGWEKPTFEDLLQLCTIEEHDEPSACKAVFHIGFMAGFSVAKNVAERIFVRTLLRAYLRLLNAQNIDARALEIESRVVLNDEARQFHIFKTQKFMDFVQDSLPSELVVVDSVDDATAKIGLGWRALGHERINQIEGKQTCVEFLHKVVDILLCEMVERLEQFDRHSTLIRIVANCEKAEVKSSQWKRTSAAILGLHGDEPHTIEQYIGQVSKYVGASIASRILIEIAICACPLERGSRIADIELSKLVARAALVARLGGLSDAIFYNALPPELTISPLGDILFRNEFGELVVEPMLSRVIGEGFVRNAPFQKKNYDDPIVVPETKERLNEEFLGYWNIEMGFSVDDARNIIDSLENKGIEDHAAIYTIKQSEYLRLTSSVHIPVEPAKKFLDQFSLSARARWDKPPQGFAPKDIYPWRFGRRLSFVARPILTINDGDDPTLIVAPAALRKGLVYVLDGAYSGKLEQDFFRSKEMRDRWWGKAREGHTFNREVGSALLTAGWYVRENIGLPEIFNCKLARNFGDVDVLAWRPDRKDVLVVECKDISLARNYSEIAALLSDYQGAESEGKTDKLRKHLDRVELIEQNRSQLIRFTGISTPNIKSCMIFNGVVPMQYAKIEALANTYVGGIPDLLRYFA